MKKFSRGKADNYNPEQYHSGIILEAIAKIRKDAFEAYGRTNGPTMQTNITDDDLGIADLVKGLQGIYENAGKALRAIPSEKRSATSRANGAKGGRPKLEPYSIEWKHARKAWVQDHHNEKWGKFWKVHYIMADTEYSAGEFLTKKEALDELKKTKANLK